MQIGEVALKKLKGYNNLHFLSKTKHKGARVFLLLLFSFFLHTIWYNSAFIRLPHLYRQLLLHYFITYSTLRDAESKLGLRLLIYPIVYGHSHQWWTEPDRTYRIYRTGLVYGSVRSGSVFS